MQTTGQTVRVPGFVLEEQAMSERKDAGTITDSSDTTETERTITATCGWYSQKGKGTP